MGLGTARDIPHLILSFIGLVLSLVSTAVPWREETIPDTEFFSLIRMFIDRICVVESDSEDSEGADVSICSSYEAFTDGQFPFHFPMMVVGIVLLGFGFLFALSAYYRHEKSVGFARVFAILQVLGGALTIGSLAYLFFVAWDVNADLDFGGVELDDFDLELDIELKEIAGLLLVVLGAVFSWTAVLVWAICSPKSLKQFNGGEAKEVELEEM